MMASELCPLCPPGRPVVAEDRYWRLVLNENQATLGRVYFALKRHETDVTALAPEEVLALWRFAAHAKRALDSLFAPDHFNYLFHMNLTPHVHMHLYPRYKTLRTFAGQTWTDTRFGDHYDPQEVRTLDKATDELLVNALREALGAQKDSQ
jgi:diadenosine tetraphosphate (Ap4A) HIT family hydrolase